MLSGNILDRLETLHILNRDNNLTLDILMDMVPWMLDVKLLQIQRDLDAAAERIKKKSNGLG